MMRAASSSSSNRRAARAGFPLLLVLLLLLLLFLPAAAAQQVEEGEEAVAEAATAAEVGLEEAVKGLGEEAGEGLKAAKRKGKDTLGQLKDEAARQGLPLEAIVERLDKLERQVREEAQAEAEGKGLSVEALEDDNKSLLEIVSQSVFDYVTTSLTPKTDRECTWSYSQGKCVPKCLCKYQFKLGDYTLSRSCRLNPNASEVADCDPDARDESDDNMLVKAQRLVFRGLGQVNKVLNKYAPATDKECDWKWTSLRCEPRDQCRFYFKLGDYHIGRSCRLRTTVEAEKAAAEARKKAKLEEEEDDEEEDDEEEVDDGDEEEGGEEQEEEEEEDEEE